jgi:Spy/CpxP family protein refolding chaperone
MKGIIRIMGVALLITAMAVPAFAWQRGMGRGKGMRGPGYSECPVINLTDEQKTQIQEIHKKYLDETSGIRDEMMKKSIDLRSVLNSSEPDAKKARAIQKDISDLRAKLAQARIDYMIDAKKICPDARFGRIGGMTGMGKFGPGFGPGRFGQ